jgi:hypothetical protein
MPEYDRNNRDAAKAVYFSVLASLDELPTHADRVETVMNLVKYVLVKATDAGCSKPGESRIEAFSRHAMAFGLDVIDLPAMIKDDGDCGECPRCIARKQQQKTAS